MIQDKQGRTPNYIVAGMTLIHRPTGLKEKLMSKTKGELRRAHTALKQRVEQKD